MHILQFICPTGYYGAERWVSALLKTWSSPVHKQHLAITLEPGSSSEVLQYSGLPPEYIHTLEMAHKFDFKVIGKLVKLIKQQNIDIIHTHGYKSDILGVIAARRAGIKAICTPHGFENSKELKLRLFMWLGGKAFRGFDCICPLSPQIKEDVLHVYKVRANRVRLIQNGVDLSEIEQALKDQNIPDCMVNIESSGPAHFSIGYIGQLISRKNLGSLLEAFKIFHNSYPHSTLYLAGEGDDRGNLQNAAHQLEIADQVRFLGFRNDRLNLLPHFQAFGFTSTLEGIPRCLMEAMAAGVCVTAYQIPGVDQLIKNNQTGICIPLNHTQALADAWLELAHNRQKLADLAEAGKRYVYDNFSAQAMAKAYVDVYEEFS